MADPRRFPIRFSSFNSILFRGLLISPSNAGVELTDDTIHVRLGWAFSARIPRRLVAKAGPGRPPTLRLTAGALGQPRGPGGLPLRRRGTAEVKRRPSVRD